MARIRQQSSLPAIPWRDPHDVPTAELSVSLARLDVRALEHPTSVNLRTCLGMAHAMNYDVYQSLDALEDALAIDRTNFWAQMKYANFTPAAHARARRTRPSRRSSWPIRRRDPGGRRRRVPGNPAPRARRGPQHHLRQTARASGAGSGPADRGAVRSDAVVGSRWKFFIGWSGILAAGLLPEGRRAAASPSPPG